MGHPLMARSTVGSAPIAATCIDSIEGNSQEKGGRSDGKRTAGLRHVPRARPDAAAHVSIPVRRSPTPTSRTTADVNHLIPVVAESLSAAVPASGADLTGLRGQRLGQRRATAAFDAFSDFQRRQRSRPGRGDRRSALQRCPTRSGTACPPSSTTATADVPNLLRICTRSTMCPWSTRVWTPVESRHRR